jgi:hypothetical protein
VYFAYGIPIDSDGNMDCLWFTSVDLYTNIIIIVSVDLLVDTFYLTWINWVIQGGTTFLLYIIFLIIVHYWSFFNSFASIKDSVNSSLFWFNIILVAATSFLFDFSILAVKYLFIPSMCRELKLVYNQYGPINTTEHLSERIIEKLKVYDEKEKETMDEILDKNNNGNNAENSDMKIIKIENINS